MSLVLATITFLLPTLLLLKVRSRLLLTLAFLCSTVCAVALIFMPLDPPLEYIFASFIGIAVASQTLRAKLSDAESSV